MYLFCMKTVFAINMADNLEQIKNDLRLVHMAILMMSQWLATTSTY